MVNYDDGLSNEERQWGNPFGDDLPEGENFESSNCQKPPPHKRRAGSAINGLLAQRGMALKINVMLSQGRFSAREIAAAIMPETQHRTETAATAKLRSHLRNLRRHGGKVITSSNGCLTCKDVKLPQAVTAWESARFIA